MVVRCKAKLYSIATSESFIKQPGREINYSLKFQFVNGNECPENKLFWDYSPSGTFEFSTNNKAAVEELHMGKEYYLDIIPAPDTPKSY